MAMKSAGMVAGASLLMAATTTTGGPMSPYLWCVIVGGLSCFTMGFGIGANDVANNFGTSIGSRAITLGKAVIIASIFELIGSVFFGASVTDSVRNGVINATVFEDQPDLLLYGNLVALITGTIWLLSVSKMGLPVSTTHSMLGALLGVGLAMGPGAVNWRYMGMVIAGWIVSPLLAAVVGIVYYLCVRDLFMRKPDPVKRGLRFLWLLIFIVSLVFMAFFFFSNPLILNGVSCTVDGVVEEHCHLEDWIFANIGYSFGLVIGFAIVLTAVLWPLCYMKAKSQLRRFEEEAHPVAIIADKLETGNALLEPAASKLMMSENTAQDSASQKLTRVDSSRDNDVSKESGQESEYTSEVDHSVSRSYGLSASSVGSVARSLKKAGAESTAGSTGMYRDGTITEMEEDITAMKHPKKTLYERYVVAAWHHLPWNRDLHQEAYDECEQAIDIQTAGELFDKRAEVFFSALQLISACICCLVHGSHDVANATAPYASVYAIYKSGTVAQQIAVPVWILFLGGCAIGVGLTFLGHHVIRKIGVELLKMSPSRGFSIEMAMGSVTLVGSFIGLPLSSTHCQVGASVGVGLMEPSQELIDKCKAENRPLPRFNKLNKDAINWHLMKRIGIAWILTFVICAASSCAIFSFSTYGPTNVQEYYTYVGP